MNDSGRVVLETETPVNPYSLLEAVNRSSDSANAAWLIYIAVMSYLLVTVAGVTHKDLLLNADISLPILQVKIDLTRFFLFAPILLVLMHMGVMVQLVLLARKTLEFAASIRMLESTDERTHPLRLELDNFFFVHAIAGPERSRLVSIFLHGMSWLTLVLMPVLLLLYMQLVFLPFHDATITWVHRLALIADVGMLAFIGVFLWRLETSFFRAFWRTSLHHPISLTLTAGLLAAVTAFSVLVATIPGEADDGPEIKASVFGYRLPFVDAGGNGALFGLFHRNIVVPDTDLVVDKDVTPGEPSLNLRGRDLRYAKLDRTDLHQADMTGTSLDGASLAGADLRGVWMQCADLNELMLTDNRRSARCASARGANLAKARLTDARMAGIDLAGARLDDAQLEGAQLAQAAMPGVSLAGARLDRADLSGAWLPGANFLLASLQGADLGGSKLQMADLANASLQGANLSLAGLEGARLRDADLEGASLQMARLFGTDLSGARMQGTDMAGARVWRTVPPGGDAAAFADMGQVMVREPTSEDLGAVAAALADVEGGALRSRLSDGLAALGDSSESGAWSSSSEHQTWQGYVTASVAASDGYKGRITDYLTRLMCRARFGNGAVATGVARRAMAPAFKGDMPAIYDRLRSSDCPASASMSPRVMRDLAVAADAARAP